jgi:hypothetical protein
MFLRRGNLDPTVASVEVDSLALYGAKSRLARRFAIASVQVTARRTTPTEPGAEQSYLVQLAHFSYHVSVYIDISMLGGVISIGPLSF